MKAAEFVPALRRLHETIRDAVVSACERQAVEELSEIAHDEEGDTIYAVDRVSEELLVEAIAREIAPHGGVVLVAEGIEGGDLVLPHGTRAADARWRVIVDPIDGTRGIMYQKRPAWILTGIAENKGPATGLHDIDAAVMTEIPLVKQHLCDALWATRGGGASMERLDRVRGTRVAVPLRPSRATSIAHGFAMVSRFFPGARDELAAIDEEIVRDCLGPVQRGKAHCFEDQYISTGGQLYELIVGHDRFVADLRPLIERVIRDRGLALGICCHPYDLATELIAREAGVTVCDPSGAPLRAPLDVDADVAWVGYANAAVRAQVEPALQAALRRRGLM